MFFHAYVIILCTLLAVFSAQSAFSQQASSAQRIITLSPHLAEMVFSAGAGDKLVAVTAHSDFPEEAQKLPLVGDFNAINIEQLIALKPDLVLSWKSANRLQDYQKIQSLSAKLGFKLLETEIYQLSDIPKTIELIGQMAGTAEVAHQKSVELKALMSQLARSYQTKPTVSAFYQIWNRPLLTVGKNQFISQGLNLCGANNIFEDIERLSAQVSIQEVIRRNPDMILLGGNPAFQKDWLNSWEKITVLNAVQQKTIFSLESDLYQRPTERFIRALKPLCQLIDKARSQERDLGK